jgi:hypothetical protein
VKKSWKCLCWPIVSIGSVKSVFKCGMRIYFPAEARLISFENRLSSPLLVSSW